MEALEIAQGRARVLEIKSKAHSMAELARRVCNSALTAEANMIARLANEKLAGMRDGEVQDRGINLEVRLSRQESTPATEIHRAMLCACAAR